VASDASDIVFALIPLTVVVGLLVLAALWILRATRLRELKQRQVLAMIEKGMAPPPEMVPLNIDGVVLPARRMTTGDRFRSGGIIVVGLGLAVGLIVGVAGAQPRVGIGVGAAIVAIGVAMIVNGWLAPEGVGARPETIPPPALPPEEPPA
jgi:hypothetical protein